ncbi:MAG: RHS repeat protein, partial [Coriobacteriales bacterium]|nr:RHS repeat protein [Coriobacteriales bacterium]
MKWHADFILRKRRDQEYFYEYDKSGLLTSLTNARGYVRTFSYDAAERLIGFTDEEGDT